MWTWLCPAGASVRNKLEEPLDAIYHAWSDAVSKVIDACISIRNGLSFIDAFWLEDSASQSESNAIVPFGWKFTGWI